MSPFFLYFYIFFSPSLQLLFPYGVSSSWQPLFSSHQQWLFPTWSTQHVCMGGIVCGGRWAAKQSYLYLPIFLSLPFFFLYSICQLHHHHHHHHLTFAGFTFIYFHMYSILPPSHSLRRSHRILSLLSHWSSFDETERWLSLFINC